MKLDFDQLKKMALKFNKDYLEDGDLFGNMDKGVHVYEISFNPQEARVRVHMQWPYFRNQVANEADCSVACSKLNDDTLHLACSSHGVEIVTVLNKSDVEELLAEHPGHAEMPNAGILFMFTIWQNLTGWGRRRNNG